MSNRKLKAAELRRALMRYIQDAITDDAEAMEYASLYPTWEELLARKTSIKAGTICRYGTNSLGDPQLYSFISDYIPTSVYTPPQDITHYKPVGLGDDGKTIWTQPYGATDAYMLGDQVWHGGKLWASDINHNVWAPGVHGWTATTDPVPPIEDPPDEPAEYNSNGTIRWDDWVNPNGDNSKLYGAGDGVSHNGTRWISNYASNGNPPSAGWWTEVVT